jgi:hypothetical protein
VNFNEYLQRVFNSNLDPFKSKNQYRLRYDLLILAKL